MDGILLLVLLGDESFPVRQAAQQALESPGCRPWLPLIALAAASPDPEIAHRADQVAGRHRRARADEWAAGICCWPWIDALPGIDSDALQRYLDGTDAAELAALGDWPRYREATRRWAWVQVASGVAEREVEELLERMRDRCEHWRAFGRYP
jgi:hypothetical protein